MTDEEQLSFSDVYPYSVLTLHVRKTQDTISWDVLKRHLTRYGDWLIGRVSSNFRDWPGDALKMFNMMERRGAAFADHDINKDCLLIRVKSKKDKMIHPFRKLDKETKLSLRGLSADEAAARLEPAFGGIYRGVPSAAAMYMFAAANGGAYPKKIESRANGARFVTTDPVFIALLCYGHISTSIDAKSKPAVLKPLGLAQLKLACKSAVFKRYYDAYIPEKLEHRLISRFVDDAIIGDEE